MEAMVKRVQLESRGRVPEDVKHLNLDCCRSTQIYGLTDEFKNLETLSMIDTGLTTLKGFPALPNLKKLELSDNRLSNGLEALQGCKKLTYLSLGGNRLKDLSSLEPLKALPNLKNLDLFNCEVTTIEDYRKKVFELLPDLDVLDASTKKDQSVIENNEDDEGSASEDSEESEGEQNWDEEEEEEEEGDAEEGGEEVGGYDYQLNYLEKSGLENESDGEDFVPGNNDLSDDVEDDIDEVDEDAEGEDDDEEGDEEEDEDEEDETAKDESAEVKQGSRKRKRAPADDEEDGN